MTPGLESEIREGTQTGPANKEIFMPRIPRMVVEGEDAVYHVMSRTALDGYVL